MTTQRTTPTGPWLADPEKDDEEVQTEEKPKSTGSRGCDDDVQPNDEA